MKRLLGLLQQLLRTGVPANMSPLRARHIILTNATALLGTSFTLLYLPVTLLGWVWLRVGRTIVRFREGRRQARM